MFVWIACDSKDSLVRSQVRLHRRDFPLADVPVRGRQFHGLNDERGVSSRFCCIWREEHTHLLEVTRSIQGAGGNVMLHFAQGRLDNFQFTLKISCQFQANRNGYKCDSNVDRCPSF
jgi:hypothetical protein